MKIIGLTGGIASGKSTIASGLNESNGALIINADLLVSVACLRGSDAYYEIVQSFGKEYLDEYGELDRYLMAGLLYKNPDAMLAMKAIVHPRVREAFSKKIETFGQLGVNYIIYENAIMFEVDDHQQCDGFLLVETPLETQLLRLMSRNGLTKEAAMNRINSQWTSERRRVAAAHTGKPFVVMSSESQSIAESWSTITDMMDD